MNNVVIEKMLTIDETGMPKAPTIRQLQDKDVALLWQRDTTKDKRKANDRPICPTCSNCNHKEFCANRKKLFKMKECEDCNNCKDKEHCDKFYIYPKFKVELLTNGRKSTTKDTNRIQFNGKTKEEALNKMLEYIQDVSIHGKTEKTKEKDATIVSICE